MTEPDPIEAALADFRIDDADQLAAQLDLPEREKAKLKIAKTRAAAIDEGEDLAGRIQKLARNDHYAALLAIAADPLTDRLLTVVPEEIRRGAYVHLDGAKRRRELARTAARRHLDAAVKSLDEYDPAEARKHLDKVDSSFLDDPTLQELNALRSRQMAANAEARELTSTSAGVLAELHPAKSGSKRRGCFQTSLLLVITAMVFIGGLVSAM